MALRTLGWEPLQTERKKAKARMMYKLLSKMDPKSLTNLFSNKNEKTNYDLRDTTYCTNREIASNIVISVRR